MIKNEGWQNTLSALKIYVGGNKEDRLRLHYLDKAKHFIRSIVGIVIFIFGNIAIGLKILAPKLVDLKTALIYIEMDITLLEIRCASLPNHRFGM